MGACFRGDTNVVSLIDGEGREDLPLMTKGDVAIHIVDKMEKLIKL